MIKKENEHLEEKLIIEGIVEELKKSLFIKENEIEAVNCQNYSMKQKLNEIEVKKRLNKGEREDYYIEHYILDPKKESLILNEQLITYKDKYDRLKEELPYLKEDIISKAERIQELNLEINKLNKEIREKDRYLALKFNNDEPKAFNKNMFTNHIRDDIKEPQITNIELLTNIEEKIKDLTKRDKESNIKNIHNQDNKILNLNISKHNNSNNEIDNNFNFNTYFNKDYNYKLDTTEWKEVVRIVGFNQDEYVNLFSDNLNNKLLECVDLLLSFILEKNYQVQILNIENKRLNCENERLCNNNNELNRKCDELSVKIEEKCKDIEYLNSKIQEMVKINKFGLKSSSTINENPENFHVLQSNKISNIHNELEIQNIDKNDSFLSESYSNFVCKELSNENKKNSHNSNNSQSRKSSCHAIYNKLSKKHMNKIEFSPFSSRNNSFENIKNLLTDSNKKIKDKLILNGMQSNIVINDNMKTENNIYNITLIPSSSLNFHKKKDSFKEKIKNLKDKMNLNIKIDNSETKDDIEVKCFKDNIIDSNDVLSKKKISNSNLRVNDENIFTNNPINERLKIDQINEKMIQQLKISSEYKKSKTRLSDLLLNSNKNKSKFNGKYDYKTDDYNTHDNKQKIINDENIEVEKGLNNSNKCNDNNLSHENLKPIMINHNYKNNKSVNFKIGLDNRIIEKVNNDEKPKISKFKKDKNDNKIVSKDKINFYEQIKQKVNDVLRKDNENKSSNQINSVTCKNKYNVNSTKSSAISLNFNSLNTYNQDTAGSIKSKLMLRFVVSPNNRKIIEKLRKNKLSDKDM